MEAESLQPASSTQDHFLDLLHLCCPLLLPPSHCALLAHPHQCIWILSCGSLSLSNTPTHPHTLWTYSSSLCPHVLPGFLLFSWLYLFSSFSLPSDFCSVLGSLSLLLLRRKRPVSSSQLISPLHICPPRLPHFTVAVFISLLPSSHLPHFLFCSVSSSS